MKVYVLKFVQVVELIIAYTVNLIIILTIHALFIDIVYIQMRYCYLVKLVTRALNYLGIMYTVQLINFASYAIKDLDIVMHFVEIFL